ncbi:MAG TPA: TetR family transcriptional regulator [Acidimicrobiia bacterium]|jgi:AcrR family transcriptional regulator
MEAAGGPGTKAVILEVARRRFAEQGFNGTSLNDIAADVGIRRQSLLYHYPSKEQLYGAVLTEELGAWQHLVDEAITGKVEGWDQVERVLRAAFRYFDEHPDLVRLIRREALDGGPMLTAEVGRVLRPQFERAVGFIEGEMAAGRLREYDARQLILTGYGAVLSYLSDTLFIERLIDDDPVSPAALKERREHVIDLLRNALDPDAGGHD